MVDILTAATSKPSKLTKADLVAINRVTANVLLQDIQEIEDRAMRLGFPITTRGLNNAKNALGWEIAGDLTRAEMATRGKRAGER